MLNQNVVESCETDEIAAYAINPDEAEQIATLNQLQRMYPDVTLSFDTDLKLILDRTIAYMCHFDTVFDMNATFDVDHFIKMKNEAIVYGNWLNSPDGTPFPESLRYRPFVAELSPDEDDETVSAITETNDIQAPVIKNETPRGVSSSSNFQKALMIYNADVAAKQPRSFTLSRMVNELGMKEATANVYYSKFKHPTKRN